jgi:hypothetical protein
MADVRQCRTRVRGSEALPPKVQAEYAADAEPLDQLRYIQQTMAHSAAFSAISGWGLVAIGASAVLAAAVSAKISPASGEAPWLRIWMLDAVIAVTIAAATSYRKAMRNGSPLVSGPARKFALGILPAVVAGAALTPLLYRAGLMRALPAMWMLLYGAGLIAGGISSTAPLPLMGSCFMACGVMALMTGWTSVNAAMALTFGGVHILFGLVMVRRNDG